MSRNLDEKVLAQPILTSQSAQITRPKQRGARLSPVSGCGTTPLCANRHVRLGPKVATAATRARRG